MKPKLELFRAVEHSTSPFAILETYSTCEGPRTRVVSRYADEMAARREMLRLERTASR